jgi:hypothetical protein
MSGSCIGLPVAASLIRREAAFLFFEISEFAPLVINGRLKALHLIIMERETKWMKG